VAHQAALDGGGRTLAVLGSGVDVIYPPEHRALAERITEKGL
jgi:DNA processing protein